MAKIVLQIVPKNKEATQSVKLLNAEVQTLSKTLSTIKVNKNLTTQINALTKHYKAVADAHAKITANTNKQAIADEKLKQTQNRTAQGLVDLQIKQQRLEKAQRKTTTSTEQLQKKFANLLTTIKGLESKYPAGTFDKLRKDTTRNLESVKALNTEIGENSPTAEQSQKLRELSNAYQSLTAQVATTRAETQKQTAVTKQNTQVNEQNRQSILSMTRGIFEWQIATTLVMKPLRALQDALASINETLIKTEDSVIALQRVLPQGSATDGEISSRLYKIAQDYGQTFDNVSQIAENFARTGMSWADTIKATEAAVLALNVAELDAEEATNGLIAILSQFGLEASDLETVIDKLNKTADNFPVTTEKILAALQRTGSAADNANLSLDQTIALITALSKATGRSGENIGTALNSLIQYSSKSSALDTFAKLSEDTEKVVAKYRQGGATILDVWQAVSNEIKNLKSEQADLLDNYFNTDDGNALKDALDGELEDIYTELGGVYDTANTFRKNYFIALLGNMDTVEQAIGTLQGAAGYSQDENQKYLDTYTAKLNSLQAKWQDIANDEQGLLGIKKDLLDIGSGVLDIIKYAGGLKTVLIALGVIVSTIVLSFKGEVIIATLTKIGTLLKSMAIDAIPNAIGAWKSFAKGISSAGTALQASLPLIAAVIIAISALDSAIRHGIEEREERERKAIEQQNEAIKKSNESVDTQKKEVAQMNEVADSVENLRKILDDSSRSEEEKAKAQDKLLQIQNTLVDSNSKYKDSLDLTNGSLKEQLGLIEQLTTEQLKQRADDFLKENESEIEIAKNRLNSNSTTSTDMLFSSSGWLNSFDFRDMINRAISGAGVGDIASINEDNTYTFYDNYGKKVGEGFKNGFWDGIGALTGFSTVFDKASYVGEANAGFSFSGTVEQQIDAIAKLRDYIAKNKDTLGLSSEEVVAITTELGNKLNELNSDEYKQAQLLAERAKATQDWLNGTIDEAEYLKVVYGIEKEISEESDKWTNNIQDVKGKYDDLISKLEELRDLEEESAAIEEKKKNYLEAQNELIKAQQALEDARNQATVRRFNQATGQWEWQVDEKKIAEAEETVKNQEENVEKAREELEKQAYDTIIKQLEDKTATNDGIKKILEDLTPQLGEEFASAVKGAIKDQTGVDLDKPINEQSEEEGQKHPKKEKWTSYADAASDGFSNIRTEKEFKRSSADKEKYGTYQAYLDAMHEKYSGTYDNGGIANGLGVMVKATAQPESVNDPELTKKILSPVSNAEFNRYVRDMGILFEHSHQYAQTPIIERVGGAVDNRVNNSGQVFIQGVNVGAEKRDGIMDALALAPLMSNN